MRRPSPLICEGLIYVFIAILASMVIAHAATTPSDPVSPDHSISQRN